ncbi:hypothetical protein D1007_11286 [Hordeum vulgare]|nr:hypothetical protein D1007_11286 [Hordeum vulgare]
MGKLHSNGKDRAKIDEWFLSTSLDHLEDLTFNDGHMRSLPPRANAAHHQVHELPFPQINADPVVFLPQLKHLELIAICIPNEDMERMLHNCIALEYLHLQAMNGLSSLHIASMSLHTICVYYWCRERRSHKTLRRRTTTEGILRGSNGAPRAVNDERQFTILVEVDTHKRFMGLSMVYTNHLIWVENSINVMYILLDEDEYKVASFDLAFLMVL